MPNLLPLPACRHRVALFLGAGAAIVTLSLTWTQAADQPPAVTAVLTSPPARAAYLGRATIWRDPGPLPPETILAGPPGIFPFPFAVATSDEGIGCTFAKPGKELGGASVKFLCITSDQQELRVKYRDPEREDGNREVFANVAASRLMWALGFGTLHALPLNLRCEGCPENPMAGGGAKRLRAYLAALVDNIATRPVILSKPDRDQGWSWREFDEAIKALPPGPDRTRQRTHFDALTLLAVFIQHGDRKPEQQSLYCESPLDLAAGQTEPLEKGSSVLALHESPNASACAKPVAMIQDFGATFGGAGRTSSEGGAKMNLEQWKSKTVFKDPKSDVCHGRITISLAAGGAGLGDPLISEEGRRFFLEQMERLSPEHVRAIFLPRARTRLARPRRRLTRGSRPFRTRSNKSRRSTASPRRNCCRLAAVHGDAPLLPESSDAQDGGQTEREAGSRDREQRAHLRLEQERANRHRRGRKEQRDRESHRRRAADDEQFAPLHAFDALQARGDRQLGRRDHAERAPDHRRDRHGPRARFETEERHAGVHDAENEEHRVNRPPAPPLEARQRILCLRRRFDKQPGVPRRVRQERDDRHQRQRRMHAADEQRHPR